MLRLHHVPLCPFCRKIRIVLREKNLTAELVEVQPWDRPDDLLRLNSGQRGAGAGRTVPMSVSDSQAITDHLEEALLGDASLFGPFGARNSNETRRLVLLVRYQVAGEVDRAALAPRRLSRRMRSGPSELSALGGGPRRLTRTCRFHLAYSRLSLPAAKWLAGETLTLADIAAAGHLSVLDYMVTYLDAAPGARKNWYAEMKSRRPCGPVLMDRLEIGLKPPAHYDDPGTSERPDQCHCADPGQSDRLFPVATAGSAASEGLATPRLADHPAGFHQRMLLL